MEKKSFTNSNLLYEVSFVVNWSTMKAMQVIKKKDCL